MSDLMNRKGISLDIELLEAKLHTKIALVSTRKNNGIQELKQLIENYKTISKETCLDTSSIDTAYFESLQKAFPNQDVYKLWLVITQDANFGKITRQELDISKFKTKSNQELKRLQQKEAIKRYQFINSILKEGQTIDRSKATGLRSKLDRLLIHKVWGYVIFFWILLTIFQAIYDWATVPMDLIDTTFASLA